MTQEEAVQKAVDFVRAKQLDVRAIRDVRYLSTEYLDRLAEECPPDIDIVETHTSVRNKLRNHWVVTFEKPETSGQVVCPDSETVCVYDSGEVVLYS